MTIQGALDRADLLKPNMQSAAFKVGYLAQLDAIIHNELISKHEIWNEYDSSKTYAAGERAANDFIGYICISAIDTAEDWNADHWRPVKALAVMDHFPDSFTQYNSDTDPGTELLVPFPYDEDVYTFWLFCKIDIQNQEIEKYTNDRLLFQQAYESFSDWLTRTHMPISRARQIRL